MSQQPAPNPHLILPVGTQVVTRVAVKIPEAQPSRPAGAVGVIVRAPTDHTHTYGVRFPDGLEVSLHRHELTIRKHFQRHGLAAGSVLAEYDLQAYVIYRCVVGSQAYGLAEPGSDIDRRGMYLPPADLYWSLYGVPEQLEHPATEECYWEIKKFLVLALKANPNVLECLYTPLVETATPLVQELLARREIFLSRLVYQTYNGYVLSQFAKMERDLRTRGAVQWKHAMHLIRLLLSGITVLRQGFVPVRLVEHRERLLAIRRGEVPWEDVNAWRLQLHRGFEAAFAATRLPQRPDYERANALLIQARRESLRLLNPQETQS